MINFFGLKDILAKERLWTNKKDHSALIKKIELVKSFNLPSHLLEEAFPLGWKSAKVIGKKETICERIFTKYPIPLPPSKSMKELSEKELRSFIVELDISFERQFEECIKIIYKLDSNDETFFETKEYLYKKFKKSHKQEMRMTLLCISCFILVLVVLIFALISGAEISDIHLMWGISPAILVFFIFSIFAFSRTRYFRLNNGTYPSLD